MPLHLRDWLKPAVLLAALAASAARAPAADVRVGDAGAKPDPAKYDPKYPDMKGWSTAGVTNGIPPRAAGKVIKTLKPGDDVQAAIDAAARAGGGGGVILLSAGTYPVAKRIDMAGNVILRGEDREKVVLENTMRSAKPSEAFVTVRFDGTRKAALEDLTIRHAEVAKVGLATYSERAAGPKNDVRGIADLHVGGVEMERVEDCWIDNCLILHSGSHPLDVQGKHVTVRDTLIDGAFNKGADGGPAGSGNVYFAVQAGLMYNVTVRNVRHALVMRNALAGGPCTYNVVLDCNFEGDVNFHGNRKDDGHNLIEGTLVYAPLSHGWPAWSYWKREDIGPENLVYKCVGWGGHKDDAFGSTDPAKVYTYTGIRDPNILGEVEKGPPTGGTLYGVTAARPTAVDAMGPWPKTPAEAYKVMQQRMIKRPLSDAAKKEG